MKRLLWKMCAISDNVLENLENVAEEFLYKFVGS